MSERKSPLALKHASVEAKEAYVERYAKCFNALTPKLKQEIRDYLDENPKLKMRFAHIIMRT